MAKLEGKGVIQAFRLEPLPSNFAIVQGSGSHRCTALPSARIGSVEAGTLGVCNALLGLMSGLMSASIWINFADG